MMLYNDLMRMRFAAFHVNSLIDRARAAKALEVA